LQPLVSVCSEVSHQAIQQDALSVLYEWNIADCGSNPNQHEIARLLKGNDGIQRLAITVKNRDFLPAERSQWMNAFSEFYVMKGGQQVVAVP
jgi:hypothetical protein